MTAILPSEDPGIRAMLEKASSIHKGKKQWSSLHERVHLQLIAHKNLLPYGSNLLLAVSGGQDSMALVRVMRDLQRIYQWRLYLWHGNHRWRSNSDQVAKELAEWARKEKLNFHSNSANTPLHSEAIARQWRYNCLIHYADKLWCNLILTAHTSSDRAETLLINIARGSDRHGMASLPINRYLTKIKTKSLIRPFLNLSRLDTAAICQEWKLPIWPDSTNTNLYFGRNRIRHKIIPILESLHPGASLRISSLAYRMQQENQTLLELIPLVIKSLEKQDSANTLDRSSFVSLSNSNQINILYHWILRECNQNTKAEILAHLIKRLPLKEGPGKLNLPSGWLLSWNRKYLQLKNINDMKK